MYEEFQKNYGEELSMILLGKLTLEFSNLSVDLQEQLRIKRIIDEVVYNYQISSKEKALVTSDIENKARLYIACKKLEGLSSGTLYNYMLQLNKFSNFFHKPVSTITSMDIRIYMSSLAEGRSEATVNTKMTPIRDFFQWLQNEEYIISNPTKKIKPVKEPKREREPLTNEQVEIIRDSLKSDRDKAIVEFLLSTGCRVGEIVNVVLSDVDWIKMSLYVIGKGNKQRKVYFNDRAKIAMKKYIDNRKGECKYLFCSSKYPYRKLSTRAVQIIIKKIGNDSGLNINLHPHLFRHTFATHNLNSGMPIEIVQNLLGHEKIDTTQVYAKVKETNVEYMYRKIVWF